VPAIAPVNATMAAKREARFAESLEPRKSSSHARAQGGVRKTAGRGGTPQQAAWATERLLSPRSASPKAGRTRFRLRRLARTQRERPRTWRCSSDRGRPGRDRPTCSDRGRCFAVPFRFSVPRRTKDVSRAVDFRRRSQCDGQA
jgi:hypothetical protein